MSRAHYALLNANITLRGSTERVAGYATRVQCIDAATVALARGKWHYGRATGELADYAPKTSTEADLRTACRHFAVAIELADGARQPDNAAMSRAQALLATLDRRDTRIWWADETPLVPSCCPIVILAGSSRDMGRQYARQCIEIFGRFIFATLAARSIDAQTREMRLNVEPQTLAQRHSEWRAPEPYARKGVLAKYARVVSSASRGAVTDCEV